MYIKNYFDFNELKREVWSDAEWTLEKVEEADKEEELMDYLEEYFGYDEVPTMTEVNDLLWFEWETIFNDLGIKNPYEEDEEEDEDEDEYWLDDNEDEDE